MYLEFPICASAIVYSSAHRILCAKFNRSSVEKLNLRKITSSMIDITSLIFCLLHLIEILVFYVELLVESFREL